MLRLVEPRGKPRVQIMPQCWREALVRLLDSLGTRGDHQGTEESEPSKGKRLSRTREGIPYVKDKINVRKLWELWYLSFL